MPCERQTGVETSRDGIKPVYGGLRREDWFGPGRCASLCHWHPPGLQFRCNQDGSLRHLHWSSGMAVRGGNIQETTWENVTAASLQAMPSVLLQQKSPHEDRTDTRVREPFCPKKPRDEGWEKADKVLVIVSLGVQNHRAALSPPCEKGILLRF